MSTSSKNLLASRRPFSYLIIPPMFACSSNLKIKFSTKFINFVWGLLNNKLSCLKQQRFIFSIIDSTRLYYQGVRLAIHVLRFFWYSLLYSTWRWFQPFPFLRLQLSHSMLGCRLAWSCTGLVTAASSS